MVEELMKDSSTVVVELGCHAGINLMKLTGILSEKNLLTGRFIVWAMIQNRVGKFGTILKWI